MTVSKNALIINAHQVVEGVSPGRLNKTLADIIGEDMRQRGYAVERTDIEKGYDVNAEVGKHARADVIILQAPVYWFGTPWIHKKYVDEVLTAGLFQQKLAVDHGRSRTDTRKQYGTGGRMQGKKYMLSLTWNAPQAAFGDPNQYLLAGKTVDDVFLGNTAAYKFCGAEILPSFSCFNVVKQADVEGDIARLRAHLAKWFG